MRIAFVFVLLAAAANAQPDSLEARAQVMTQIEEGRERVAALPNRSVFQARWVQGSGTRLGDGASYNTEQGKALTAGISLKQLLEMTWTVEYPFSEDPISTSVRARLFDGPDSLLRHRVAVEMSEPGLTRAGFGSFLRAQLADALGLEFRFEPRPTVVYALRATSDAPALLAEGDVGERMRASTLTFISRDQMMAFRDRTSAELANDLGGALGHVVVDETGLDGTYSFRMDYDADEVDFEMHTMPSPMIDAVRAGLLEAYGLDLVPEVRAIDWMVVRPRKASE